MVMKWGPRAAALAFAAAWAPAAAAGPPAEFRSGGVRFELPLPDGYCLPSGPEVDLAQLLAAGDTGNVTHLTLLPCVKQAPPQTDYILLKTPKQAILLPVERGPFLEELGAAFDNPEFASALASGKLLRQSEKEMSEVTRTPIDLSGDIKPLGRDDVCAYLGGTMTVASPVANYRIAVGVCMTVVGGRLLSINWYGPDQGSEGVAKLLLKSKQLAGRISGKPAS